MFSRIQKIGLGCFLLLSMITGVTANNFVADSIKEGKGIRPESLGYAFTAVAEAESAIFYNPAGIATPGSFYSYQLVDFKRLNTSHYHIHSFQAAPFAFANWSKVSPDGEEIHVNSLGYGKMTSVGLDWGISYKSIRTNQGADYNHGWSSDLGMLFRLYPNLVMGLTVQDFLSHNVKLPISMTSGIGLYSPQRTLGLSTDFVFNQQGHRRLFARTGLEINLLESFKVRAGLRPDYVSAGVSASLSFVDVDYSITQSQQNKDDVQYNLGFSVGGFGKGAEFKKRYSFFKPKSYAQFKIGRHITEGQSEVSLLGGMKVGSNDLLSLIRKANKDKSCKGYIITVGRLSGSLPSLSMIQEIRSELVKAKSKGKKIYVYIEGWATLPEYYLASIADKIYMPPLGTVSQLGIKLEVLKTSQFLEKFGLTSVTTASGVFKDALKPDSDLLNSQHEYYLNELMNEFYQKVIADIQLSRELDWTKVSDVFDGRLLSARSAKELGLIDDLCYVNDFDEKIIELIQKDTVGFTLTRLSDYQYTNPPTVFSMFNRIAVIEIDGSIVSGSHSSNFLFGGKSTGSNDIAKTVRQINQDPTIKGVILRVNSPGGSLMAADHMYEVIGTLKEHGKLVYTSMGNSAASGGYYVSMNSDKIYASPSTLTGSIGVISSYMNFYHLQEALGIKNHILKTGKYMDLYSPNKQITDDDKRVLQTYQDDFYQFFVSKLIENRDLTEDEAFDVAQGQVFSGMEAQKLKLVDDIGGFYKVVDDMQDALKLDESNLVFYRHSMPSKLPFLSGMGQVLKLRSMSSKWLGLLSNNWLNGQGDTLDLK